MTRFGILSDVHGNLPALEQVLAALDAAGVDQLVCLGDLVGYNADSDACVARLAERGVESIAGNHDLIAIGRLGFERCADKPAFALRRTRATITASTRALLEGLPARLVLDERAVGIHGGYADVSEYLFGERQVLANHASIRAAHPDAQVCWFGHTHEQAVWDIADRAVTRRDTMGTVRLDGKAHAYFINPGSVDASRKSGVRLAEFAIFDGAMHSVAFHRMPYDDAAVERRAEIAGYRMSRADELLYAAARRGRRGAALVRRGARRLIERVEQLVRD